MTEKCFDLGLVMAGAVSAGAYTAGVMDYLIQALNRWEALRDSGEVPNHTVKLRVMAGASAGGMTSSISAAVLSDANHTPVTSVPRRGTTGNNNRLYNSWVDMVDISELLKSQDLVDGAPVLSILDSTIIQKIAEIALDVEETCPLPSFVDPNLQVYITTANLRGVPYALQLQSNRGEADFFMSNHADFGHFYLGDANTTLDGRGATRVALSDNSTQAHQLFRNATMGTGSFPIGLAPRTLAMTTSMYEHRMWRIPLNNPNSQAKCYDYQTIAPSWPQDVQGAYTSTVVDGGTFNNEPLEFARRVLTRTSESGYSPMKAESERADKAILMIDPFPSEKPAAEFEAPDDLLGVATSLLNAMRKQSMFKIEELVLAQQPHVASRFMIAPARTEDDGTVSPYALASGGFGAFGGFLAKPFREHDFQLGRRNCQRFLQKHLVLKKENPLFDDWRDNTALVSRHKVVRDGQEYLPIIPVVDGVDGSEPLIPWPKMSANRLKTLRTLFGKRARDVGHHVIAGMFSRRTLRVTAQSVYKLISPRLVRRIMKAIEKDLTARGQI